MNLQQTILLETTFGPRNYSTYYRYTPSMTFNQLGNWEWDNQPYFNKFKNFQDCMVIGVL